MYTLIVYTDKGIKCAHALFVCMSVCAQLMCVVPKVIRSVVGNMRLIS